MFMNLPGLRGRVEHRVLRKAVASCGVLALGTALACAASVSAGAATRSHPRPVKPGLLYQVKRMPSGNGGVLPASTSPANASNIQILNGFPGYELCLDAENDSGGNPNQSGDKVQLWTCNVNATQQRWNVNFGVGTVGTITSQYGNHLCLDAETDSGGNPTDNGDKIQMWTCNSNATQQKWTLVGVSNGSWTFVNQYDPSADIVLAAENDSGGSPSQCGDNVQVQSWAGQFAQTWNTQGTNSGCL